MEKEKVETGKKRVRGESEKGLLGGKGKRIRKKKEKVQVESATDSASRNYQKISASKIVM
jgi:hypothetical protein